MRIEWHHQQKKAVLRKRYIALFDIGDQHTSGLAVFEEGSDGWFGVTTFDPGAGNYGPNMEDVRNGVRIYRRE